LLSRDTLLSPTKGEGPLVVTSRPTITGKALATSSKMANLSRGDAGFLSNPRAPRYGIKCFHPAEIIPIVNAEHIIYGHVSLQVTEKDFLCGPPTKDLKSILEHMKCYCGNLAEGKSSVSLNVLYIY
jgi:hypothetical protein